MMCIIARACVCVARGRFCAYARGGRSPVLPCLECVAVAAPLNVPPFFYLLGISPEPPWPTNCKLKSDNLVVLQLVLFVILGKAHAWAGESRARRSPVEVLMETRELWSPTMASNFMSQVLHAPPREQGVQCCGAIPSPQSEVGAAAATANILFDATPTLLFAFQHFSWFIVVPIIFREQNMSSYNLCFAPPPQPPPSPTTFSNDHSAVLLSVLFLLAGGC